MAAPQAARRPLGEVLAELPLHRYPDGGATRLKAASPDGSARGPRSSSSASARTRVIGILLAAFDRPRAGAARPTVLYPTPTFVMYPITSRIQGFTPIEVPLDDRFDLDADAMCEAIAEHRPNLVFLATPNNPTGNAFDEAALRRIVAAAPDALVVIDEAYAPFAGRTYHGWVDEHPNVGVMSTLSKIGLAGLRVGWIRMHPELAHEAEKARPPYNLSLPAQRAATLFLEELSEVLDEAVARIVEERDALAARIDAIDGLRVLPSAANFFLVEVPDAEAWRAALLERGIQVRAFAKIERLRPHLRITVGTPEENGRLVDALQALCDDPPG
ncbi:MAG: histidinol-phosphate transaminase [Sandaracinaceae bacterium]